MRRKWWESPVKFICDHLWFLLLIIILVVAVLLTHNLWGPRLFPEPIPAIVLGTGDVQVTLVWEGYNDLDLHVIDPSGEEIFFSHPTSISSGQLDVDSNGGCGSNITNSPVENIFWPTGDAPSGEYSIYVVFFQQCDENAPSSEFEVRLKVSGEEQVFHNTVSTVSEKVFIADFSNENPNSTPVDENVSSAAVETPSPAGLDFDPAYLSERMLQLINESRKENGLSEVSWDNFSAGVAEDHSREMTTEGYISHWDLQGYGPDVRYGLAGGVEWVQENVYLSAYYYENGGGVPIDDWDAEVIQAHESLMNSPGHRANILSPDHSHVGLGFAYNPGDGYFAVAQEFMNKYVAIVNDVPHSADLNEEIFVQGKLLDSATNPLVNLFYESFPTAMDKQALMETESYSSPAEFVEVIPVEEDSDQEFSFNAKMGDTPGIYHVMIWVDVGDTSTHAIDLQIWVGN